MEMSFDLDGLEQNISSSENTGDESGFLSEFSIVPSDGVYLGLDISENSSGVTLYENGEKERYNISLDSDKNSIYSEVLLRRELSGYLLEIIDNRHLDIVVLEDAFQGPNPLTTRILYALNTAMLELIIDGKCTCDKLIRVPNTLWKSWLYRVDPDGEFSKYNDKERIRLCLEKIGIFEEGKGYQDRLDSTGMLIGYFLEGYKSYTGDRKPLKISMSDLVFSYKADVDFITFDVSEERGLECDKDLYMHNIGSKRLSKDLIISLVRENPLSVHIISDVDKLGVFGASLGLEKVMDGSYLGFWVKKSKYKKLLKELKEGV